MLNLSARQLAEALWDAEQAVTIERVPHTVNVKTRAPAAHASADTAVVLLPAVKAVDYDVLFAREGLADATSKRMLRVMERVLAGVSTAKARELDDFAAEENRRRETRLLAAEQGEIARLKEKLARHVAKARSLPLPGATPAAREPASSSPAHSFCDPPPDPCGPVDSAAALSKARPPRQDDQNPRQCRHNDRRRHELEGGRGHQNTQDHHFGGQVRADQEGRRDHQNRPGLQSRHNHLDHLDHHRDHPHHLDHPDHHLEHHLDHPGHNLDHDNHLDHFDDPGHHLDRHRPHHPDPSESKRPTTSHQGNASIFSEAVQRQAAKDRSLLRKALADTAAGAPRLDSLAFLDAAGLRRACSEVVERRALRAAGDAARKKESDRLLLLRRDAGMKAELEELEAKELRWFGARACSR
ncbi:hypothetical protein DIPPA_16700 [Diplonema papillatum]|nr:hypothetical protein DIPPA_16700 [Diplonema papillatum]